MTDLSYTPGTTAPDVNSASGKTALKRAGISIGAMLFGVYGLGAVLTYRADDPSLNVATNDKAQNLFGGPGAVFADFFMQTLGAAAPVALSAIFAAGAIRIARKRITNSVSRERLMAGAGGVILLAGAASAAPTPNFWPLDSFGGVIGDGIAGLLTALFSLPGLPAPEVFAGLTAAVGGGIALAWAFSVTRDDMAAAVDSTAEAVGKAGGLMQSMFKGFGGKLKRAPEPWETFEREVPLRAEKRAAVIGPAADEDGAGGATEEEAPRRIVPAPIRKRVEQPAQSRGATPQRPTQQSAPRAPQSDLQMRSQSENFDLPGLDLLATPKVRGAQTDGATLQAQAKLLAATLADYGVQGDIISARPGPVVTLFELEPAPGVKSSRVIGLAEDIARSMSAESCRVAVIPGRNAIGIELPNPKRETVYLRTLMGSTAFVGAQGALPLALGETIEGEPFAADLAKMPHLLIAGTTGSGKSVGLNAMILSLLFRHTPEECRFIMIDPKMIELSIYEGIPHLLTPVVTESKKSVVALKWVVREMEERYRRMQKFTVKNIQGYNDRVRAALDSGEMLTRTVHAGFNPESGEPIYETQELPLEIMPHIVVVIDEVASLMLTAGREVEAAVQSLAQMARAAGIHVIMATQRPSVDVITGVIKANFPTRLSYKVATKVDSRTIIGESGAEQLVGQGDCLFMGGGGRIVRLHGPYVEDDEVLRIVEMLRAQGTPQYRSDVTDDPDAPDDAPVDLVDVAGGADDEFYDRAVDIVARDRKASTSYLQRKLSLGYNRAAKLIERMEIDGVISRANHAGRREILVPAPNDD
ncbi:MAG: DNA translocase FtsK 4TM domain-containing protein [Alphaproteobacteria bacterium]|nr:DNA translocase FtsK 4TM domain-containing protein [Alphaproteobacteria bacterium]